MNTKTQTRGNCPCCGRDQAVIGRLMSKHGYTVEQGWFNGVCSGERYAPMQVQREVTDQLVHQVRQDVKALEARAADLRAGRVVPELVEKPNAWAPRGQEVPKVEFSSLLEWEQERVIETLAYKAEARARAGTSFANQMEELVNKVHGQPLRQVEVEAGPAPILVGERRTSVSGAILKATRIDRGRVYWQTEDERKTKGWTGTQAWRRFPLV